MWFHTQMAHLSCTSSRPDAIGCWVWDLIWVQDNEWCHIWYCHKFQAVLICRRLLRRFLCFFYKNLPRFSSIVWTLTDVFHLRNLLSLLFDSSICFVCLLHFHQVFLPFYLSRFLWIWKLLFSSFIIITFGFIHLKSFGLLQKNKDFLVLKILFFLAINSRFKCYWLHLMASLKV